MSASRNNDPLSVIRSQLFYARLYTDKKFRDAEFSKVNFSDQEKSDILFFAQSLINKRRGVVSVIIPETKNLLGEQFQIQFQKYAEANSMKKGVHKHQWDTYFFLDFIRLRNTDPALKSVTRVEQEKILYVLPVDLKLFFKHANYYFLRLIRLIIRPKGVA